MTKFYPGWAEREPISPARRPMKRSSRLPKAEEMREPLHSGREDLQPLFNPEDYEDKGNYWARPLDED